MSKLYEKYQMLKSKNPSCLYLFKSGIFYIFLDEDAKLMSNVLGLKLTNLNENVVKCGFPIQNLEKYLNLIKNFDYSVEVLTSINSTSISDSEFLLTNDIYKFLTEIANTNSDTLSIKEAFSFIDKISLSAKRFIGNFPSKT